MRARWIGIALFLLGGACSEDGAVQRHEGRLEAGDPIDEERGAPYDPYTFTAHRGDRVELWMTSSEVDSYLVLYDGESRELDENDDIHGRNRDAKITFTAPSDGTYTVHATSYEADARGPYALEIEIAR